MEHSRKYFVVLFFILLRFISPAAETIAISYFDNTSKIVSYDPLSKGISDMLITDLSKIEGITIVERSRLEDVLKEIELNKSKYFDEATAQKLGKGLGAKFILTGAYLLLNDNLRIDARMIDVQSGRIIMTESVNCSKDDFFSGYKQLVDRISRQMKQSYAGTSSLAPKSNNVGLNSVLQYSKALDFADKGLNTDASELLASTVKQYPDFGFAKNKLEQLKAWMKEMDAQHELQVAEETKKLISGLNPNDALFGQRVNKVWTLLLTSWSYSKILAFNNELRAKKIPDDLKLYGEASPIVFGEMLLYYECLSLNTLKEHQKMIEAGKQFMEKYPTSMYYSGIKMYMEQALAEMEKREKGKAVIDEELLKTELKVYIDYFQSFKFRNALELMSKKDYEFYKNIYSQRVLNFGDEQLRTMLVENKFSLDELFAFKSAAERFQDGAMLDQIAAKSKIFGDDAARIEEQIVYNKKNIEAQKTFLADAQKKYAGKEERDVEFLLRNAKDLDQSMDFGFEEKVMRLYLQQTANAKNYSYRHDAWKYLAISVLAQGRTEDAKVEFKNYQNDKVLFAQDSMRFKRELLNFKNEFNEKLKTQEEDKSVSLQQAVYEKKADAYAEHDQYADEAATRLELINNYNLPPDKNEMQLYKLSMAYQNIGYFDEARKAAKVLTDKYPQSSFAQAIESLVKYMPQ